MPGTSPPAHVPGDARGSKLLRDVFVCLLALLCISPLLLLFPRASALLLLLWPFCFVVTPWLPRAGLRRLNLHLSRDWRDDVPTGAPIAVLAGGFGPGGDLSARTVRRLRHAIALAEARGVGLLLCGGALWQGRTEAAAMALRCRELGFRGPVAIEDRSRTTLENLMVLGREIEPGGAPRLLVTCPHHLARVLRLCRALAIPLHPVGYPVEDLPRGARASLDLAAECFYECAIHVWLTLRGALVRARLCRPLGSLRRRHLEGGDHGDPGG